MLCATHRAGPLTSIVSSSPTTASLSKLSNSGLCCILTTTSWGSSLSSCHRQRSWEESPLPKVVHLVNDRTRTWLHSSLSPKRMFSTTRLSVLLLLQIPWRTQTRESLADGYQMGTVAHPKVNSLLGMERRKQWHQGLLYSSPTSAPSPRTHSPHSGKFMDIQRLTAGSKHLYFVLP